QPPMVRIPSRIKIGGRSDSPATRPSGCAAPLQRQSAIAPNRVTWRSPSPSIHIIPGRPPVSRAAARRDPRAIHRKLTSETSVPAPAPAAPCHPASSAASDTAGSEAISVARVTRPTSSWSIALLLLGLLDGTEQVPEPRGDADGQADQGEPGRRPEPA